MRLMRYMFLFIVFCGYSVCGGVSGAQASKPSVAQALSESSIHSARSCADHVVRVVIDRQLSQNQQQFFDLKTGPYSGVIVSSKGEILICDTILGEFVSAEKGGRSRLIRGIYVSLGDGRTYLADVIGRNRQYDLALLKIDAEGLEPIDFSHARAAKRGEAISVVTRSLTALRHGVRSGICSAESREAGRAFQIDARVGACDLGGLVLAHDGTPLGVIGELNVRLVGQATGVAYVVDAETIVGALEGLRAGEFVEPPPRPFLGVAAEKAYTNKPGLSVSAVMAGSGAAIAGIQENDILLEAEDEALYDASDLERIEQSKKVGETLKLKLERNVDGVNETIEVIATLRSRD